MAAISWISLNRIRKMNNIPKAKAMAKYAQEAEGNVERFEMTRKYGDRMLRLDFANSAISHRLTDATKYSDNYLDDLFKECGIIR